MNWLSFAGKTTGGRFFNGTHCTLRVRRDGDVGRVECHPHLQKSTNFTKLRQMPVLRLLPLYRVEMGDDAVRLPSMGWRVLSPTDLQAVERRVPIMGVAPGQTRARSSHHLSCVASARDAGFLTLAEQKEPFRSAEEVSCLLEHQWAAGFPAVLPFPALIFAFNRIITTTAQRAWYFHTHSAVGFTQSGAIQNS
ncbi:hypothetical protein N657DRAFT_422136 [Parathielavia appendiculata]|uniref:Uncharacterized protein n=1 Tax=Parathielavia appendiculata TaxID=2587402 RepID=A0AAN6U034_9PEZI|nr:hypothetical protein N657DRAFT_422136 [Parathielavia appendiculata]